MAGWLVGGGLAGWWLVGTSLGFGWLVAGWLVGSWLVAGWLVGGWSAGWWLVGWLVAGWLVGVWLAPCWLHCNENPINVFPERNCAALVLILRQSYTCERFIYIPRNGPHISCSRIGRPIYGIHKSLTDI